MKHARLVCNQRESFQCDECYKITSGGHQLISDSETRFVCNECYARFRGEYPKRGKALKNILPMDVVFSEGYDPDEREEVVATAAAGTGYVGILLPKEGGGWRVPTAEELDCITRARATAPPAPPVTEPAAVAPMTVPPVVISQPREVAGEGITDSASDGAIAPMGEESTLTVKYRFTTDNKLQLIVPARCRIDNASYEIVVETAR